jgi:hypothetical protein
MADRGKASWTFISAGSNTTVKATPGTLYALQVTPGNGGVIKVNGSPTMGQFTDMNSVSGDTIGLYGPFAMTSNTIPDTITFGPGIGFEGLSIAATSNTRVLAVYE